jgi:hypothetical protein
LSALAGAAGVVFKAVAAGADAGAAAGAGAGFFENRLQPPRAAVHSRTARIFISNFICMVERS